MHSTLAPAEKKNNSKSANSNNKTTQRKVLPSIGKPIQLKGNEEESLQGKFKSGNNQPPAQLVEEEEAIQGKFESANQPAQLVEEEEPLQGKFESDNQPAQLVEEEEPLQGKFESANQPAQLVEDEEPLQGKFESGERKSSPNWAFQLKSNIGNSTTTQKSAPPANKTGLPDSLKSGVEQLSGISMDDVKVNYNSANPAQLHAHAYAQGKDIHVSPGQEKHVPHEAWHVVQQKQGRVKATTQLKESVPVNDDKGLENEADVMGAKAVAISGNENSTVQKKAISNTEVAQLASWKDTHELAASDPQFKKHKPIWTKVEDGTPNAVSTKEDQPPEVASSPEAVIAPQTEETTAEVAAVAETTAEVAPAEEKTEVVAPEDTTAAVAAPADATAAVAAPAAPENLFMASKKTHTPDIQQQPAEPAKGVKELLVIGGKTILSGAEIGGEVTDQLDEKNLKETTKTLSKAGVKNPIEMDEKAGSDNDIAGVVLGGFNAMKGFVESAKNLYVNRDFASGAKLFASMAEVALEVVKALETYKVIEGFQDAIPAIGPAISAFKQGVKIYEQFKAIEKLEENTKDKGLSDAENETIQLFIGKIQSDRISTSIDFILDLAKIAGDFFPPGGAIISAAKIIKLGVVTAMGAWTNYKAGKEKQAFSRVMGSEEGLSEEDKGAITELNGKINEKGNKSDSILDFINTKLQIENLESQIEAETDPVRLADLNTSLADKETFLSTELFKYNEHNKRANVHFVPISNSDIGNLAIIHKNVIHSIIEQAYADKDMFDRLDNWYRIAEDKDKIMLEVFGRDVPTMAKIDENIMVLSEGEHAAYFWGKTKAAMEKVTKGRKYHSKKELQEKTKKILEKYNVPAKEISKIII